MFVLDTSIVSEVMRAVPAQQVLDWFNDRDASRLFLTSISIAEIRYGLRALPDGNRRRNLEGRFGQFVHSAFESRILGFGEASAHC